MSDFPESLREARALDGRVLNAQQYYADQARIAELERRLAEIDAMLDEPLDTFAHVPRGEKFRRMRRLARGEEETT
jgi:hypothetical protein